MAEEGELVKKHLNDITEGTSPSEKEEEESEEQKQENEIKKILAEEEEPAAPLPTPIISKGGLIESSHSQNNFEGFQSWWLGQKKCCAICIGVIAVVVALTISYRLLNSQPQIQLLGIAKEFPQKECLSFFPGAQKDANVLERFRLIVTSMHYHMEQLSLLGISAYHLNYPICLIAVSVADPSDSAVVKKRLVVFMHDPEIFALGSDTRNIQEVDVICGNATSPLVRKRSTSIQLRWKDHSGENFISKFVEPESYLIQHLVDIVDGQYNCTR